jgi:hypothetical protein
LRRRVFYQQETFSPAVNRSGRHAERGRRSLAPIQEPAVAGLLNEPPFRKKSVEQSFQMISACVTPTVQQT